MIGSAEAVTLFLPRCQARVFEPDRFTLRSVANAYRTDTLTPEVMAMAADPFAKLEGVRLRKSGCFCSKGLGNAEPSIGAIQHLLASPMQPTSWLCR